MGIPKFFRYIAQRWPLTSQLVNDNVIPEFDNMYLDMNSIVHMCTHANAQNVGHLDEDMVFQNIGNYIEHLFSVVQPKEVFFMAIDGVAPRAKMNQQRGRRFRSAKDAEEMRRKAAEEGLELDEDPFDSNCITPGTIFMAQLTQFLKYFIARKISEDTKWQGCKIILSGHEVPGEGEHKIMSFIRNIRSQPEYNQNTRHCLYGLDADLIMLGLSTHEPHFSLLREEVTFGRKIQFQSAELSEKRFNLLHLSLVREYIQLELNSDDDFEVKPDFERQLDDFILIMFFIGNDFLPELPMLMINDGAIPVIFDTYKEYLRTSGNKYLSENGKVDFSALKQWMEYLKSYQVKKFEEMTNVSGWFTNQIESTTMVSGTDDIVLSKGQHEVFDFIFKFMRKSLKKNDYESELEINEEPSFVSLLAEQTGFSYNGGILKLSPDSTVPVDEAMRVLRIYNVAKVHDPARAAEYDDKFVEWKNRYYIRKFGDSYDSEKIQKVSTKYLEGLQWVLFYYYRSCPSWSWYFDDHYAPMTTELITAIGDGFEPKFDLGEPFRPFEQLMSVLPDRSAELLPPPLRHLLLEETSPIKDFYPHTFELDRNGKKAEWESVVLIPFIDQDRLLKYVRPIEDNELTDAEQFRNSRGQEMEFNYNPSQVTFYASPSARMPPIDACTCVSRPLRFPPGELRYGRLPDSLSGVHALAGFPSLNTLPYDWSLERDQGVKVFEMPSRDYSIILSIHPSSSKINVGKHVYINWPFLREAKITSIKSPDGTFAWSKMLPQIVGDYKRVGVDIGETEIQVGVKELQGLRRDSDGSFVKDFDGREIFVPAQMLVHHVNNEDSRFAERKASSLEHDFPIDSNVLLLLAKYYGYPATIKAYHGDTVEVEAIVPCYRDPVFTISHNISQQEQNRMQWFSLEQVSRSIDVPVKALLKLTSRLVVESKGQNVNVALSLRKHGLGLMADGYSRLGYRNMWEFSDRAVALLVSYLSQFRTPLQSILKGSDKVDASKVQEMRDWLSKYTKSINFIPTTTTHWSEQGTKFLEQKLQNLPATHLEKILIKGVERGALLSSTDAPHVLRSQSFRLGDRVVSALDHGKVPIYSRGVVVGINGGTSASNATLDVVWDHEFGSASTLDGRTTTQRGLTVRAYSVLNLTKTQMQYIHGSAPLVTKISAKVDTRNTIATKSKPGAKDGPKPSQQPKYAPAPARNEWEAIKQARHAPPVPMVNAVPVYYPAPLPTGPAAASSNAPAPSSIDHQATSGKSNLPSGPKKWTQKNHPSDSTKNKSKNVKSDRKANEKHPRDKKQQSTKTKGGRPHASKDYNSNQQKPQDEAAHQTPKESGNSQAAPSSTITAAGISLPEARAPDPEATRKLLSTLFSTSQ